MALSKLCSDVGRVLPLDVRVSCFRPSVVWSVVIIDAEEDELEVEEDEEETQSQPQSAQYPTALPPSSSRLGSEVPPSPLRLLQRRNQVYAHSGTSLRFSLFNVTTQHC